MIVSILITSGWSLVAVTPVNPSPLVAAYNSQPPVSIRFLRIQTPAQKDDSAFLTGLCGAILRAHAVYIWGLFRQDGAEHPPAVGIYSL